MGIFTKSGLLPPVQTFCCCDLVEILVHFWVVLVGFKGYFKGFGIKKTPPCCEKFPNNPAFFERTLTSVDPWRPERSPRKGREWRSAPMFQVSLTMGLSDFVACCECLDDQIYSVMEFVGAPRMHPQFADAL